MSVLDPSPFIEDPQPSAGWMGQGPQAAAQGNIGGLQRALIGRAGGGLVQMPSRPGSTPIFSDEMGGELERALQARIRSPEQLQDAESRRRGALDQLTRANKQPLNDNTWDANFMEGIMSAPYGANAGQTFPMGVANAMAAQRKNSEAMRAGDVANATAGLGFEQNEEKLADNTEKTALSDASRVMIAQSKQLRDGYGAGGMGQRFKWTKEGMFDLAQVDDKGVPKLVFPASQDMTRFHDAALRRATQLAMNPGMEFPSVAARDAWIQNRASQELAQLTGVADTPMATTPGAAPAKAPATPGAPAIPGAPDPSLVQAVKAMESGGNQAARSPVGAVGVMQVMPKTGPEAAKLAGLEWDKNKFENDASYNEALGTAYLAAQQKRFGNDVHALAAYNWGPDNVDKWLKAGGDPRKLPTDTRLYIGDVMAARARLGQAPGDVTVAASDNLPGGTQGGATPVVNPLAAAVPGPVPAGGPIQKTKGQLAQETSYAKDSEASAAKTMDIYRAEGTQSNDALAAIDNISKLRDQFVPGKFAGVKEVLGSYLDAGGFTKGGLPKEARTIQMVNKVIAEQVNNRMTLEHGVQTEGDTQRFREAYANVKDTPQAFDFMLGMLKERALRQQERLKLAEAYSSTNKTNVGVQQVWNKHRDEELGPMLIKTPDGPIFRHDYIEKGIASTLAQHPDADPEVVRGWAAEAWLKRSKGEKK